MAQAMPYWQQAGTRAIRRSANVEAIAHMQRGLALLTMLPDTPQRTQSEFDFLTTLGPALMATKGYAALVQRAVNTWRVSSCINCRICRCFFTANSLSISCARYLEVVQAYTRARELCQQAGETAEHVPVLCNLWFFYMARGEHQTAMVLGEQCLQIAQHVQDAALLLEAHYALGVSWFLLGNSALAGTLWNKRLPSMMSSTTG